MLNDGLNLLKDKRHQLPVFHATQVINLQIPSSVI